MTIYLDMVFILNFVIDFLILLTLSITLKYKINIKRILFSSLLGSLSLIILFVKFNPFCLFFIKLLISIIMITTLVGYKNIKRIIESIIYFYFISILYGGFLYFIIDNFTFKNNGFSFIKTNTDLNIIILVILSPIILYIYIKQIHKRYKINLRVEVKVKLKNKFINLNGFIDTGNNLKEPYTGKDVMITNNKFIKDVIEKSNFLFIPYESINGNGFIKGSKFKEVIIGNKKFNNVIIAYMNEKIFIEGVDIILNSNMIGDLND